jgi:hypothetical protein
MPGGQEVRQRLPAEQTQALPVAHFHGPARGHRIRPDHACSGHSHIFFLFLYANYATFSGSTASFVVGSYVARTVVLRRCEAESTADPTRELLPRLKTPWAMLYQQSAHYVSYLFFRILM